MSRDDEELLAIVGLGCRLPGNVSSPAQLWQALCSRVDGVVKVPAERWAGFDAALFGIAPGEAEPIDAQRGIALETAWAALEDARLAPTALRGTQTSVFFGACVQELGHTALVEASITTPRSATGADKLLVAEQIASTLGFEGPATTVASADGSLLLAVHLAAQSLRLGECDLALAGGVSFMLTPPGAVPASTRDEGCGVVVVRRLSDAARAGDRIYAILHGSAVEHDSASQGLVSLAREPARFDVIPSVEAQAKLMRAAWHAASVAPREVSYVEIGGTGRDLGELSEAAALREVFARDRETPLLVNSVPTNFGQAASGITSLLKVALSLFHGELAPDLSERASADRDPASGELETLVDPRSWPDVPRRFAGVSSFAPGATHAHVALGAPPPETALDPSEGRVEARGVAREQNLAGPVRLLLSAASEDALRALARELANWIRARPNLPLDAIARSLAATRACLAERAVVVADGPSDAVDALLARAEGREHPALDQVPADVSRDAFEAMTAFGKARVEATRRCPTTNVGHTTKAGAGPVFVFSGYGSQWPGMGRALLRESSVFRETVEACDAAFRPLTGWSVLSLLAGEADPAVTPFERADVLQPALFSMSLGLSAVWRSFGIEPAAVIGHSQGEILAAVVAGALSLEDAARVVVGFSRATKPMCNLGGMLFVELSGEQVLSRIQPYGDALSVGAFNGPSSTVVTGELAAIEQLALELKAAGVFCGRVKIDHAGHSAQLDAALPELSAWLGSLVPNTPRIPFCSAVLGRMLTDEEPLDRAYWCRNLRQPVQFSAALEQLIERGHDVFLEMSAHPVLSPTVALACEGRGPLVLSTLKRERGGIDQIIKTLPVLSERGHAVRWQRVLDAAGSPLVDLPIYPFQRAQAELADHAALATLSGSRAEPRASTAFADGLRALPEDERLAALIDFVRSDVAHVLGLSGPKAVRAEGELREIGLDSLIAVQLRNRLSERLGRPLPATLVFDYPSPKEIAKLLSSRFFAEPSARVRRARPARSEGAADEPIAIVGMACRLPRGVTSPEQLWAVLAQEEDLISAFPERWASLDLFDADPDAPGKSYCAAGGFLDDIEHFDASFFGISPREAQSMDPQQRLVLETAWEALERAGIVPAGLEESATGVYVGATTPDYAEGAGPALAAADGYYLTGTTPAVISGRVAYTLGLQGPALTIDTACSSSLVALHLACVGLRHGECDLALAGGVHVLTQPTLFVEFSRLRGLAPDGRCKSFAAQADGTSWAEGCGILVLKRLSDAERDGHKVLALLRGTAVNQDGRSQGLTAPNGPSQQRLVQAALAACQLTPDDIDALEAHGTGTKLGDPIEAVALAEVFGPGRDPARPVFLGSLKSNLGHSATAAGVASVIKMVLALQHELLPKTLHAAEPTPLVDWASSGLALLQQAQPWRRGSRVRRAGVSGFGVSGTNAHVIVEEAPAEALLVEAVPVPPDVPLLISGRDRAALCAQAERWASWLEEHPDADYGDVLRTAALGRTHFAARAAVWANDAQQASERLRAWAKGDALADVEARGSERAQSVEARGSAREPNADARGSSREPSYVVTGTARALGRLVFVFPGQGSQWPAMGSELWAQSPVFRAAVTACDAALLPFTGWSVASVLRGGQGDAPPASRVDVVQPALFTMAVALAAVWRSLGIEPAAVVGTSQGEVAAAVVAGALSLEDGARIVALRSQLLLPLAGSGAMAVVQRPVQDVTELLARHAGVLSVAGVNTPDSTIVAGDLDALEAFVAEQSQRGVFCKRVDVDYASHSHHMEPLLPALRARLAELRPAPSRVPMVSTLSGAVLGGSELDADYWCRNLREPIRLDLGLAALMSRGQDVFLEVSAHPVLAVPLATACAAGTGAAVSTLSRAAGGLNALYRALAELHVQGYPLAWERLVDARGAAAGQEVEARGSAREQEVEARGAESEHKVEARGFASEHTWRGRGRADLPTYAFQRTRHWRDHRRAPADLRRLGLTPAEHPMLQVSTPLADGEGALLTGRLSLREQGWLSEHQVFERALVPGAALLELALAAGARVGAPRVEELILLAPAVLAEARGSSREQNDARGFAREQGTNGAELRVQIHIDAADEHGQRAFRLHGLGAAADAEGPWALHATGTLAPEREASTKPLAAWPPEDAEALDVDALYARLAEHGVDYGPTFRGLERAWRVDDVLYGEVALPSAQASMASAYGVHPALLDAALHVLSAAQGAAAVRFGSRAEPRASTDALLPYAWSDVALHAQGANALRVRVELSSVADEEMSASISAFDESGQLVMTVGALHARRATAEQLRAANVGTRDLYQVIWRPVAGHSERAAAPLLVVGGDGALANRLGASHVASVQALSALMDAGQPPPARLVFDKTSKGAAPRASEKAWSPDVRAQVDARGSAPEQGHAAHEGAIQPGQVPLPALAQEQGALALAELQQLLSDPRLSRTACIWVTSAAVSCGSVETRGSAHEQDNDALVEAPGSARERNVEALGSAREGDQHLAHAPLWGMLRVARHEHPERVLRALDLSDPAPTAEELVPLLALDVESELAVRGGRGFAARLEPLRSIVEPSDSLSAFRSRSDSRASAEVAGLAAGTVLITGGAGELGGVLARHLVETHGVRRLLLTSRRGPDAAIAPALRADLESLGADVDICACDVADRDQLARAVAAIDPAYPLTGVFHLAGVLDDGLLSELNAERLARVLGPKLAGAWHLHELTKDCELAAFVMFSSYTGVAGNAGQGSYAAANRFLDALASHRRSQGLPAHALAFGLWQPQGAGMTSHLGKVELSRIRQRGILPLAPARGMELLDAALGRPEPELVPVLLDTEAMQRLYAENGGLPPLLRSLVRPSPRRVHRHGEADVGAPSALRASIAKLPEAERLGALVALVQGIVAKTLGLSSAAPAQQPLRELGLDSLMAVEIRNQLSARAETSLPATLVFDHPTPEAIAKLLWRQAFADLAPPTQAAPTTTVRRSADDAPIAIIGMACRTPGGVADPEAYWALLDAGRDAVGPFPARWDVAALYDPDPDAPGKSYVREGGFLSDVEQFDAAFFGIAPREASAMDPQQRLVLEVAWEALERAGIRPEQLSASTAGVYVGSMGSDYASGASLEALDGHLGIGRTASVLSGRVSYVLGLEGPAITVDTACSSSLVALHLACGGLRQGECDLALAGGVQVMSSPATFVEFSRLRALSQVGRCKSFSDDADGAGWSEGCGILVLKRLADATRDDDKVLALVRGSAVNQDGRSQGLTAPNGPSQERVIQRALAASGLRPTDIDAVEGHGTGTPLGDPMEAGALAAVFAPTRVGREPLYLGSSKSNLGHTQAAAGVLGVIKMVLALRHERLPKTLHAAVPSRHVAWEASGMSLLQEARPWPRRLGHRRRAGVSSFGISGTNAHLILEEAPSRARSRTCPAHEHAPAPNLGTACTCARSASLPLLVSGRDEPALRAQAVRWASWLAANPNALWADVVHTAAVRRTHFERRAALLVSDAAEAQQALLALAEGAPRAGLFQGVASAAPLAMLFTGQGSQRVGMGRELWGQPGFAEFTRAFDEVVEACDAHLDRPLKEIMWAAQSSAEADLLSATRYTQPALFALEVALCRQWQAWGVEPQLLIGHSVGELACAHVAEVLSLSDAALLVCARGRLMEELATPAGAMASVAASAQELEAWLSEQVEALGPVREQDGEARGSAREQNGTVLAGTLEIAGLNTPRQTVVSGDRHAVQDLVRKLRKQGREATELTVSHAFHSAHMDGMLEALRKVAEGLRYQPPTRAVISNVTGKLADAAQGDLVTADYWVRQVRQAVRFSEGIACVLEAGVGTLLECGPTGVLCALAADCVEARGPAREQNVEARGPAREQKGPAREVARIASLRREQAEPQAMAAALAQLHVHGQPLSWPALTEGQGRVELPTYAFQHQPYWLQVRSSRLDLAAAGLRTAEHPLLGAATSLAHEEGLLFTGRLAMADHGWLADHRVFERALFPGAGMVELALAAGRAADCETLTELTLSAPLSLDCHGAVWVQVHVGARDAQGCRAVTLHSRSEAAQASAPSTRASEEWRLHASGVLSADTASAPPILASWPPAGAVALDVSALYPRLRAQNLAYGPAFQGLRAAFRLGDTVYGEVALDAQQAPAANDYGLHPALLDAALHLLSCVERDAPEADSVLLPFAWSDVKLYATGAAAVRVRLTLSERGDAASLALFDQAGQLVLSVGRLELRAARAEQLREAVEGETKDLYQVSFEPQVLPEASGSEHTLVLGSGEMLSARLGAQQVQDARALRSLLDAGASAPTRIVVDLTVDGREPNMAPARGYERGALGSLARGTARFDAAPSELARSLAAQTTRALSELNALLAEPRLKDAALVWVTAGALCAAPGDGVDDLSYAPLWGLLRSARAETPDRVLRSLDLDGSELSVEQLRQLLAADAEAELLWREGKAVAPRLVPVGSAVQAREQNAGGALLAPRDAQAWRLDQPARGSLSALRLVAAPEALAPLAPGQVRIAVRAAGVNFRDALNALGMVDTPYLGLELSGEVLEVGVGVERFCVGDRVMGLGHATFATVSVADARLLTRIPANLSYSEAATIPLVFLTALYGLRELGGLRAGERVLIHAAAGGVGMAALQLAQRLGAEVYGTASPSKWALLAELGVDASRLANSRDTGFEARFLERTAGAGFDVVLNALAGEFVDASLRLLPRGGRFLEMGKTDIRDAASVSAAHPGVHYQAFDLMEAGHERIGELLDELSAGFARGELRPLPVRAYALQHAPSALRYIASGRHVGKLILQPPRQLEPAKTVLITGGVGELGRALARHLVAEHGVRHLVLTSRRGPDASEAQQLVASLKELGAASVVLAACDVSERAQLERVLSAIDPAHPLTGVFHLAGVLDDGVLTELNAERLSRVLRPKVDGALHLHALTEGMDLAAFVLFSSIAGVMGGAGQANYAAANTFLDALAAERRSCGLAGQSLAWGLWQPEGAGMTAQLGPADLLRMRRAGLVPLSTQQALRLLDAALLRPEANLAPVALDLDRLRAQLGAAASEFGSHADPRASTVQGHRHPSLLRVLVRPALRRVEAKAADAPALRAQLAAVPESERLPVALGVVQEVVAAVLGLAGRSAVSARAPLKDMGLDSLMAVEVRNQLSQRVQRKLPATLVFDYPTPEDMARLILEALDVEARDQNGEAHGSAREQNFASEATFSEAAVRAKLNTLSIATLRKLGVLEAIMAQPRLFDGARQPSTEPEPAEVGVEAIFEAEDEALFEMAERMLMEEE